MSDLLTSQSGCRVVQSNIIVCLPFCHRDWRLMHDNLAWQAEMKPAKRFECILIHDGSAPEHVLPEIEALARKAFLRVGWFQYPIPIYQQWPQAPNYAFQCTANYMKDIGRPWFWMEADCIPLVRDWMERLETEYDIARKPFLGCVVPGMGHVNGVAIYPPDTPERLKKGMASLHSAWDAESKDEMIEDTHNAAHLIQHAWGVVNGQFHPSIGEAPTFDNPTMLQQLIPGAAVFHRCKDKSLIARLRERKK